MPETRKERDARLDGLTVELNELRVARNMIESTAGASKVVDSVDTDELTDAINLLAATLFTDLVEDPPTHDMLLVSYDVHRVISRQVVFRSFERDEAEAFVDKTPGTQMVGRIWLPLYDLDSLDLD